MENNQLSDAELTPEELARREKNRARKQKIKEQKANQQQATTDKPKPQNTKVRLTDEEYTQQQLEKKSTQLGKNPKGSVVSIAETTESRSIAFKINEINMITDNVRSSMGTDKISFEDGAKILKFFKHNISDKIDGFMELAYSYGIGSKWSLVEYDEKTKKEKARAKEILQQREKFMAIETPIEAKEREAQEKVLEKATVELEKLKESLHKAEEALLKAQTEHEEGFKTRIAQQRERAKLAAEATQVPKEETPDTTEKIA